MSNRAVDVPEENESYLWLLTNPKLRGHMLLTCIISLTCMLSGTHDAIPSCYAIIPNRLSNESIIPEIYITVITSIYEFFIGDGLKTRVRDNCIFIIGMFNIICSFRNGICL